MLGAPEGTTTLLYVWTLSSVCRQHMRRYMALAWFGLARIIWGACGYRAADAASAGGSYMSALSFPKLPGDVKD